MAKSMWSFLLGVMGSSIRSLHQQSAGARSVRDDNSALVLVLPYATAEYLNNEQSFHEYYDEIEICAESAGRHFKSAHQIRNRSMVDRSDLIVFCVEHNSGGAFQTMQYAKRVNANIINFKEE